MPFVARGVQIPGPPRVSREGESIVFFFLVILSSAALELHSRIFTIRFFLLDAKFKIMRCFCILSVAPFPNTLIQRSFDSLIIFAVL